MDIVRLQEAEAILSLPVGCSGALRIYLVKTKQFELVHLHVIVYLRHRGCCVVTDLMPENHSYVEVCHCEACWLRLMKLPG